MKKRLFISLIVLVAAIFIVACSGNVETKDSTKDSCVVKKDCTITVPVAVKDSAVVDTAKKAKK